MPEAAATFQIGDRVTHPAKPEWGVGEVRKAASITHEGRKAQRLEIRFGRAGLKTISTAFAPLKPAEGTPKIGKAVEKPAHAEADPRPKPTGLAAALAPPPEDEPPPPKLDPAKAAAIMAEIPEPARDPFRPLATRIETTIRLYEVKPEGRSLMDWAATQSGLDDPLSMFSRHDLEQHFERYRIRLDQHLRSLLDDARRERLDTKPLLAKASENARAALRRINHAR